MNGFRSSALLALLFYEVGLEARPEGTPSPTYFEAGHLKSKEAPNVRLLGISGIENVNWLGPDGLNFASEGLTVIYGDNGSGKTGFHPDFEEGLPVSDREGRRLGNPGERLRKCVWIAGSKASNK